MAKVKTKKIDTAVAPVAPVAAVVAADAPVPDSPKKKKKGGEAGGGAGMDLFSQCVLLCQNQQWREAALLGRKLRTRAIADGNMDLVSSLDLALAKIDYSLRRQMAAAAVRATTQLLAKEFLLDVG